MKKYLIFSISLLLSSSLSFADTCEGIATARFRDEGGKIVQKGENIEHIHGWTFDKQGNPITYAQHGGYIWPANKVKLLNCHVEKIAKNGKITANLILDDTPENQKEIKYQKTEMFLGNETSLCNAANSNAAWAYVYDPQSTLGRVTANFIKGRLKDKNYPEPQWPEGTLYGKDN